MKRNTKRHRSDDNFLHAMEGKVITVYRGGSGVQDREISRHSIGLYRSSG